MTVSTEAMTSSPCWGGTLYKLRGVPPLYQWAVVLEVGDKFYISARSSNISREEDIGPFSTLQDAIDAASTIHILDEAPAHWPRFPNP